MKEIILFLTLSFVTLNTSSQNNSGNCPGWLWAVSRNGLAQIILQFVHVIFLLRIIDS